MKKFLAALVLGLIATFNVSAQKGKDGSYTVTAAGDILNSYTSLTASATTGNTSITVASNAMNSGFFTGNLAAGDLIFIIQTKGVSMRGLGQDVGNVDGIAGNDTVGFPPDFDMGRILDYHNCGNFEFAEVVSTSGGSIINLRCALENDYTVPAVLHTGGSSNNTAAVAGTVQIIRVPRFTDLTVNAGASITAPAWNGTFGGAVILEVETNTTINGTIDVSAIGFRGGDDSNLTLGFNAGNATASTMPREGGRKGEGIGGYMGSYSWWGGMHGRGAMANAGGGGTSHNSGGGGGANAASIAWSEGRGNPDLSGGAGWINAWNLETAVTGLTSATTSGGGGRGGYSLSQTDLDATQTGNGPNQSSWGGDYRRVVGGYGGRPLDYSTGRLFFGGGGGAGEMNDNEGGAGGNAGGLVFIKSYGDVVGSGSIEADGQDGFDAVGPPPGFAQISGNDGAGGGGAGGTVVIDSRNNISGITINANGGNGGDQILQVGSFGNPEVEGPGGGGGGGYVRQTASTATVNFAGGTNGTTDSPEMTEFTPNGATMGSDGDSDATTAFGFTVEDDTICGGGTATLTITTYGTIPGGTTTIWYSDLGSTIVGTGNSFTTPVLASNTTYYVGMCPGANLCEVNVVVSPAIIIDQTGLLTANENCGNADGSITGITASGGTGILTYDWNGNSTIGADTVGIAAGSYTLTVTDANGCSETAGPFNITNSGGPTIDASGISIVDEACGNGAGSITGITASGTGTLTYDWNGNGTLGVDTLNLAAGSYTLTVTDGNGCTATSGPHTVNNLGAPTIDISNMVITNETCSAGNGSITGIIVTGASSPVYDWNSTITPTPDLNGVGAGSYTFTVTDGACSASVGPFSITDSPDPVIDVTGMTISDENCGQGDGSITGITVTGTPTLTYTWNGSASATPDLTNQSTGNYTLIATDGNGCTATVGPFNIGSYAGPVIDVTGLTITDESCLGNDGSITGITVTGTATIVYDWSGNITPTADLTGQAGGSFTLLVTDGVGCTASSGPHTINTISGPVIDASNIVITDENCGNGAGSITGITATGSGTLTYDWNGNTTLGADTLNLAGGSYTLTVTDGNGCTATSGPHTVNNNGAPTIDISNMVITNETCSAGNGSITGIIVTGATSPVYDWNSTITPTTDLNGVGAGFYTFTVTDGACTASAGPFAITDSPAPVIDVSGMTISDENCGQGDGSITGITVTGTPTITYTWNGNASATPDLSGQASGNYTLIATDGNGCTSSVGPFNIGTYAGPTIDISGMVITDESCFGNDGAITGMIVTGNGTITYDWSGNITPTADLTGQTGGFYTLTVTDGVGCTASSGPHTIVTTTGPIIDITNMVISDENCGNADGSITGIIVSGGSGTLSYDWSGNSTPNADLNNQAAGTFTLIVTDAAGCTATTGPHTINGTPPVVVGFTGTTTICEGQSTTLTANGGTTYQWTPGGSGTSISVTPTVTTNYELIGTTGPCSDTINFTVTVNPLPQTVVTGDTIICEGEATTLTSSGSFNFEWDNGNLTNQITVSPSITTSYQVIASNSCGDDTVTTVVTVNPLPTADAGLDQTILVGGSANLNGSGGTMYSWSPPDGLDCTNCEDPIASPLSTTTYYVTVTDGNGCSRIDSVTVTVDETSVLFIPNIFSPNGDGLNDILEVKGGGIETFVFRIFDRWGEKVFETSDLNVGWDGTFRGQNAVQGVYIYGISGNYYDGTKIDQSGNITLVR